MRAVFSLLMAATGCIAFVETVHSGRLDSAAAAPHRECRASEPPKPHPLETILAVATRCESDDFRLVGARTGNGSLMWGYSQTAGRTGCRASWVRVAGAAAHVAATARAAPGGRFDPVRGIHTARRTTSLVPAGRTAACRI